jgi:DNA-nicking Smr family endonuclease
MASRRRISDDDAAAFHAAVGDVRRLHDDRAQAPPSRPPARPRASAVARAVSEALLPDGPGAQAPGFAERQFFARPGIQQRVLRRLARGQLTLREELDLHGMRVDEARAALARFLDECAERDLRCVRIITGKGYGSRGTEPVLKAQLDRWLRLRPQVLAFCSATARDGGTGAVYVLLRSSRQDA